MTYHSYLTYPDRNRAQRPAPSIPVMQRMAAGHGSPAGALPLVNEALQSQGQSLDAATAALMGARFGHDFSRVRLHTDALAARSAKAVNALAYTVGEEIVFAGGRYSPRTEAGRKLLAHELAHVVQQGPASARPSVLRLAPHDRFEAAAETAAGRVANGLDAGPAAGGAALGVQREEEPGKGGDTEQDTCAQYENDNESFSIKAAQHFLTEVDPGASQSVKSVSCTVNPNNPLRIECDVTFTDGQVIHVTWIKDLNNVEAQRQTPNGRQWCVYHYICDTPGTVRYVKKGCSDDYKPKPPRSSGPDLVGSRAGGRGAAEG